MSEETKYVWVVFYGNWHQLDSVWETKEEAWKRAEAVATDGWITPPQRTELKKRATKKHAGTI